MIVGVGGLARLTADFGEAAVETRVAATAVVHRGANNVVRDARDRAPGGATAPHYPASIGYDMDYSAGAITAEIGPDKRLPQGALGNIFEYGTSRHAPQPHLGPALEAEADQFEQHMDGIADIL